MSEACATCRFWLPEKHIGLATGLGECRRFPPVWTGEEWDRPRTRESDQCGEYAPEEATNEDPAR